MMPSLLLTILLVLLFVISPHQEVAADDGNHNRNWEDGFASWEEFGHDNSDNCNIPKLTVEEWEMGRYWEGNVPVIVKNVTGGWAANHNWKLSEMLERYPDAQATMGDATLIGRKGPDDLKSILTPTTIKEFITKHMYNPHRYFFDRSISIPKGMMEDCFPLPLPTGAFFEDTDPNTQHYHYWRDHLTISIGSNLQGLAFHQHNSAWNVVIFGKKRWVLWDHSSFSTEQERQFSRIKGEFMSAPEWIRTLDEDPNRVKGIKENGYDCIQHAGDLMFVPSMLAHMVVNIGDTVAIVSEADLDKKDTDNKGKDIRRRGTRRQKKPEDIDPESALTLLNNSMKGKDGSTALNILRYHLCPQQKQQAASSISPDGNVNLLKKTALVSHNELIEALSMAIGQLYEAEAAGELNSLQKEKFLNDVVQVAMDAKLVFIECFGEKSDVVNEYVRDLQDVKT